MKYDVFFSYSRKDTKKVFQFVKLLEEAGFKVWIDRNGVRAGDEFKKVIVDAIDESCLFVFFSSKNSNNSSFWTEKEISYAQEKKKTIIPVKIDDTPYVGGSRLDLTGIDYISVSDLGFDMAAKKLIDVVNRRLNNGIEEDVAESKETVKHIHNYKRNLLMYAFSAVLMSSLIWLGVFFKNKDVNKNEDRYQYRDTVYVVSDKNMKISGTDITQVDKKELMNKDEDIRQYRDTVYMVSDNNTKISEMDITQVDKKELKEMAVETGFGQTVEPSREVGEIMDNKGKSQSIPDGLLHEYSSDSTSIIFFSKSNDVRFVMKLVEGGTYLMGAQKGDYTKPNYDDEAEDNESPVHQVSLNSFYLGETEVTQALWLYVFGSEPKSHGGWIYGRGDNYPVYYVSFKDCCDFIERLNTLTGMNFRLPTEEEWEYAARGGKNGKGYKYAGGNDMDVLGWYGRNSGETYLTGPLTVKDWECVRDTNKPKTHPVKTKSPNELGIYDLSGNVWELCSNKSIKSKRKDGKQILLYLQRGGSWGAHEDFCRVSSRQYLADNRNATGFRLALTE